MMGRPLTKSHKCKNTLCENIAPKNKFGNYKTYCSDECKKAQYPKEMASAYKNKDMESILKRREETNLKSNGSN